MLTKTKSSLTFLLLEVNILFAFLGGGEDLVVAPDDVDDGPGALSLPYLFYDRGVLFGQEFTKQFPDGMDVDVCTAVYKILCLGKLFRVYDVKIVRYPLRKASGMG